MKSYGNMNIMEVTHQDITQLKEEFSSMKLKFDKVYYALVGNELAGDGGLVKRLIDAELELEKIQVKIESIEKRAVKSDLYVNILWAASGVIATAIFTLILNYLTKK